MTAAFFWGNTGCKELVKLSDISYFSGVGFYPSPSPFPQEGRGES